LVVALANLIGNVDDRGRPVVRIEVPGHDELLAVVDTGFNRSLFLMADQALVLGFTVLEREETVELGTTERTNVHVAIGHILWFGATVKVEALVAKDGRRRIDPDAPRALIGTKLLAGCHVLIDFPRGTIEVESSPEPA
jgi:predicted aspartyl protease